VRRASARCDEPTTARRPPLRRRLCRRETPLLVRSHSLCAAVRHCRRLRRRPRRRRARRRRPARHTTRLEHVSGREEGGAHRPLRPPLPRRPLQLRGHVAAQRLRLLRVHTLRLRPLRHRVAALFGRTVRAGAPRRARPTPAGRPAVLRRPRPRRPLRRPRTVHPRAAQRHQRLDRLARRVVFSAVRRRADCCSRVPPYPRTMAIRPNRPFGPSSWTGPFSTASSNACARRSA
jgi:hypothetical protein